MIRKILLIFILYFLVGCAPQSATEVIEPAEISDKYEDYELEIIAENLDTPWSIDFLPDDTSIFTERGGNVGIIKDKKTMIIAALDVNEVSESGLLGITVDPDYKKNNFIYVYYTYDAGNRVSRFTLEDETLSEETILLDNIPNAKFHDGGRVKFGPDGKLYITTGDAVQPSSAQDINSLAGKILRMNKDGSIPEDNPFRNYVYSYGHRNPQGLAWNEEGKLFSSEHGPTRNDEINIITLGGNYGWPQECTESGDFMNPIRCFTEFTIAPGSLAYHENNLYVSGLRGTQLRKLTLDEDNSNVLGEEELFTDLGRIREVVVHGGYLYFTTSNYDGRGIPRINDDKIMRVKI